MEGDAALTEWNAQITENLNNFRDASITPLANEINHHKKSFLQVVEVLGPSLTSTDVVSRHDALRIVVTIAEKLQPGSLNEGEIETLLQFLLNRLQDHQMLIGLTIRGLLALVQMQIFEGERNAITIINSIGNGLFVPSLQRVDRLNVYLLFEVLVDHYEAALQEMGSNLLMRFIACMEGEHEPRNLLVVFRTMAKIFRRFEIEPITETAFDVLACYFPIDFTPANQEDVELKETLTLGLRRCMSAVPGFTKYSMSLIIEKLSSDSNAAKEEGINTLIACCEAPSARDVVMQHLDMLWNALRREVLASPSDSIERAALKALTTITALLSSVPNQETTGSDQFITMVLNDMQQFLKKPELQLQYSAGKILRAVSAGSHSACNRIANTILPICVLLFMEQLRTEDRLALMNVMSLQLREMALTYTAASYEITGRGSIAAFYQSLLMDTPQSMLTCMAISGLSDMLKIKVGRPFLEDDRVAGICETLMNGIMDYENSGVVDEVVHFFTVVGQEQDEEYIYKQLLPRLFEYIKNREVLPIPTRLLDIAQAVLRTSRPNRDPSFFTPLLLRIQFLDENGPYVPTMKMYLDIIATYVDGIRTTEEAEMLYTVILFPTFRQAIHAATSEEVSGYQDISILETLSTIYRRIISHLDDKSYRVLVDTLDKMYLRGDTSYKNYTGRGDKILPSAFKPLEKPYVTTHTRCISIMTSIVCSAPKEFVYTHDDWKAEVQKLMETCCFCADEQSSVFAAQCIGGIFNRIDDETALNLFLGDVLEDPALARARNQERRFVRALVWITKGLVLRSQRDDLIRRFTEMIVQHLKSPKSGEEAADGIRVILEESPFVLTPQMNCNISPLHRQKFFSVTLPLLLSSFNGADMQDAKPTKRNYLVALSHLLKYVPLSVSRPSMPEVVPFLLQSLNSDDPNLLESTLTSIEELLVDSDPTSSSSAINTQFIPPLIERLLELSVNSVNMNVRMCALRCLGYVSSQLAVPPLLPFKQKVIRHLGKCLDDKKRRVREVAVTTRASWFLVGSNHKAA